MRAVTDFFASKEYQEAKKKAGEKSDEATKELKEGATYAAQQAQKGASWAFGKLQVLFAEPRPAQSLAPQIEGETPSCALINRLTDEIKSLNNPSTFSSLDQIQAIQFAQNKPKLVAIFTLCIQLIEDPAMDSQPLLREKGSHQAILGQYLCKDSYSIVNEATNFLKGFAQKLTSDSQHTVAQPKASLRGIDLVDLSIELAKKLKVEKEQSLRCG